METQAYMESKSEIPIVKLRVAEVRTKHNRE
jgi:hypothetical protein